MAAVPAWAAAGTPGQEPGIQGWPRVRAEGPLVAEAIEQALAGSPTFRQLVAAISATDGIVYVHHGPCGRNVLACLLLSVTQAGPNRILHIKVDTRRTGLHLMVSIGHELRHALELLNEPAVVDAHTARNFYQPGVIADRYNYETEAAIQTELAVDAELRQWMKNR
jgi:hypothetical protein